MKSPYSALAAMALLCVLAYWRSLFLPFISDDYLQIRLARDFGPVSGWKALAADALYRCRATSLVLTHWTERAFGLDPFVFSCSSLLLHILNTWLVFAFGAWRLIGWRLSTVAACFFAVYQGHQEAVIWYAALPELLVFFFVASSFLLWILWLRSGTSLPSLYLASLAAFLLALLSKESAVALPPLLVLVLLAERKSLRRFCLPLLPFAALSIVYFALSFAARRHHLHYNDGTFSLHAPFYWIEFRSIVRLLWVWGFVSLAALAAWRASHYLPLLKIAAAWVLCTLLPYSFLTYMPFVPSRHTYLAGAGLSLLIAAAFLTFANRFRPALVCSLAALIIFPHCAYLWTKKQRQFLERAAPTELLIHHARVTRGPIRLRCFPYHISIAQSALDTRLGPGRQVELVNQHASLDLCLLP
ncbi:MAG: hypothetical protein LC126_27315 [Bryobacterales bacterium]|nr:hypothetical protein [Bryobacterales bacterium]